MKNALIVNCVMVNNGDAGLVFNLHQALSSSNVNVTIATHNYRFSLGKYPSLRFCRDVIASAWLGPNKALARLMIPILMALSKCYRSADLVIGAPGGYINSYYGFKWKLHALKWAKLFGKRTILYSQSIGPLSVVDGSILREYSRYIDVIMVRDQLSLKTARSVGVAEHKLKLTEDAIFLQQPTEPNSQPRQSKRACISVREWKFDERDANQYREMIKSFTIKLVDHGYDIVFMSTCQGIAGYVDDSVIAKDIISTLNEATRRRVKVCDEYLDLFELQEAIRGFDLVVGTRLHMCLLSILNGVPAFNISYEAKGSECYSYLDASSWTVDYNASSADAAYKFQSFLDDLGGARNHFSTHTHANYQRAIAAFQDTFFL